MTYSSSKKLCTFVKFAGILLSFAMTVSLISCASVQWEEPNSASSPLIVNAGAYTLPITILADSMFSWPLKLKSNDTRFQFQSGFYITYQATYANDIMGCSGDVAPGLYVINFTLDNSSWSGPGLLYIQVSNTPIELYIDPLVTVSYGSIAGPSFNLVSLSPWTDMTVTATLGSNEFTVSPSSLIFRPNSTTQGFTFSTNGNTKSTSSVTVTYTLSGTNRNTYNFTQITGIVNVPGGSSTTPNNTQTTTPNTTQTNTTQTNTTTTTPNTTTQTNTTTNTSTGGTTGGTTGGNNNTWYWNYSTDTSDWFDLGNDSTASNTGNINQTTSGGTTTTQPNNTQTNTTTTNTTQTNTTKPQNTTNTTTTPNTTQTNTTQPNTTQTNTSSTALKTTLTASSTNITIIAGTFNLPLTLTNSGGSFKSNLWCTASTPGFMFNPQLVANSGSLSQSALLGTASTTAVGNYNVTFWCNDTKYPSPVPFSVKVAKGQVTIPKPSTVTVNYVNGFSASSVPITVDLSDFPPWQDVTITPTPSDSNWVVFPAQLVFTAAVKKATFTYQVKPSARGSFNTTVTFKISGSNAASYVMGGTQTLKGVGK